MDGRFLALTSFFVLFLQSHCSLNLSASLASASFDDSQSLLSSEFGAGFVPGGPDAEEKQSVSDQK